MAPNSPACSFIHASMAGSRSTAPSNRSNSVLIISLLSAFESCGYVTEGLPVIRPESATGVNEASNLPEADPLGRKQDFIGFQKKRRQSRLELTQRMGRTYFDKLYDARPPFPRGQNRGSDFRRFHQESCECVRWSLI